MLTTLVLTTCASATEFKLTASDGAAADFFGQSVSISGDYAAVVSEMNAPTEGITSAKPGGWGLSGFTAVFAIVGLPMLVWVVVVRRRRRDYVALQTMVGRMINHYFIGFLVYPESLERGCDFGEQSNSCG